MDRTGSWHWQLANRIRTPGALARYVSLDEDTVRGIEAAAREFSWAITPYYASLMDRHDPHCPIRLQSIPSPLELDDPDGTADPLMEERQSPVEGLIHRYPDRVAMCVSSECAMYCRHCERKRMVGRGPVSATWIDAGIEYVRSRPEIRDVLLTGGDPLVASDEWIDRLLSRVRAIEHVEIVRIGTRTLCTMPQRITPRLADVISRHHPVWINTQFNHPRELTEEAWLAADTLLRAGIPLGNQSVLLRGVNDDPAIMRLLVLGLVKMRIRPYYLYRCEVLGGTRHFRTTAQTGLDIIESLRGHVTGFSVPQLVVDTPIGKVPLNPEYVVARGEGFITVRNWEGDLWTLSDTQDSLEATGTRAPGPGGSPSGPVSPVSAPWSGR